MKKFGIFAIGITLFAATILVGCDSGDGGDDSGGGSGLLSGKWVGFQVTATNGIAVTRDLTMKLSHDKDNHVSGTKQLGDPSRNIKQTVDGEFFPTSSVLDLTVISSGSTFEEVWRLEDGGSTMTLVSGGSAQVSRAD